MSARDVSDTTLRYPREMSRGTEREWWVAAETAAAEETFIRAMFAEPNRPRTNWPEVAIYVIAVCVAVWFGLAYFTGATR